MKTKCDVYRCSKKVDLELNPTSKLARVEASEVLAALGEQGYFLQMPPADLLKAQAPGSGFIQ